MIMESYLLKPDFKHLENQEISVQLSGITNLHVNVSFASLLITQAAKEPD